MGPAPPVAEDPKQEVNITPQVAPSEVPIGPGQGHTEERVEYRDEQGKLLNDEEVKSLEGKVSFSTRYETRTRLLDADGNEIQEGVVEPDSTAGTLAEGEDPATASESMSVVSSEPAKNDVGEDIEKEKKIGSSKQTAEPESPIGKPSGKDEL